jgi:cell division septal protein FtsQ
MKRVLDVARRIGWKVPVLIVGLALVASAPWWGTRALSHLSYFRIRRVEIYGRHYVEPRDLLARLGIDTSTSIWTDLGALERRVASHPQVHAVTIERRLPGTLVLHITENLPVAFVPAAAPRAGAGGLWAVDVDGRVLPIDPSRASVDVPLLPHRDLALLKLLADVRVETPSLFRRISTARRTTPGGEVTITLDSSLVRAPAGVTAGRLADIIPVERDLARRHARVAELDLRFRDQVIARLQ